MDKPWFSENKTMDELRINLVFQKSKTLDEQGVNTGMLEGKERMNKGFPMVENDENIGFSKVINLPKFEKIYLII